MEKPVTLNANEWADIRGSLKITAETLVSDGFIIGAHEIMALFHKVAKQTTYDD